MSIKAVIFDLDGTITQPFFNFGDIRFELGLAEDSTTILEEIENMPPAERKRAEDILNFHESQAVVESKLNVGAAETLSTLRKSGIHIGILTRNKRENVFAIAEKHNLDFDAVVGRDDGPPKPDGFGVLNLCEQFGVKPAETLMVGDYLFDLLCGRAAGAISVLLANTKEAENFTEHADFVIERIDEILEIVNGQRPEKIK